MAQDLLIAQAYLESEDHRQKIVLSENLTRVGSNSDCKIILNDPVVSRRHALFRNIDGHWLLQDLGSTNGTWVNDKRIEKRTELNAGDRITIGRTKFVFCSEGRRSQSVLDKMFALQPYEFEKLIGQLFTKLGFDATVTNQTGDGGVDVEVIHKAVIFRGRYLIQCKSYNSSHKVTRPEIQAFHGRLAMEPRARGIFITTSSYTRGAQEAAELTGINLIDGKECGLWFSCRRHSPVAPFLHGLDRLAVDERHRRSGIASGFDMQALAQLVHDLLP
jgi:pSer/pThr/pTyr-binding forkhead associated (FHA) protein